MLIKLLVLIASFDNVFSLKPYDVHWLTSGVSIERGFAREKSVDIYCYRGADKYLLNFLQSVKVHCGGTRFTWYLVTTWPITRVTLAQWLNITGYKIKIIIEGDFTSYIGENAEETYKKYVENSYGWSVLPFQSQSPNSLALNPFNTTCLCVKTDRSHKIQLETKRVDLWLLTMFISGILLIFLSRTLSGNTFFFYMCGIVMGVLASFLLIIFYISKLFPRKPMMYGFMISGGTVGMYLLKQIWMNIQNIAFNYRSHIIYYTALVSFISFIVCYRIGPPKNQRSKNIVMWSLQGIGSLLVYFSSYHQEASASIVVICLIIKYFPRRVLNFIINYWYRRFPPKHKFLTNEEYYEQGARETMHALGNLRKYASSPDCAQWRIMLKLNDSQRFASFVEGNSHLSDEEILNYESYAFDNASPSRLKNTSTHKMLTRSVRNMDPAMEISSDESSESDLEMTDE